MSLCSKPGCARPGSSVLSYQYGNQLIVLADATDVNVPPHEYLLCAPCSERLKPPRGWSLDDRRAVAQPAPAKPPALEISLVEVPSETHRSG